MIRICLIISYFLLLGTAIYGQTNRALLIGIDHYPFESGWSNIHGTNDIQLMYPLLIDARYKAKDIIVLKNEKATKKGIVEAFERLSRTSKGGDNIYVQISTHGQQMVDDNGDEPDGLDEAIIPHDAKRRYNRGVYEGENHLRDDELAMLLEPIRNKIGKRGNLIVVLDACHSATGTRWSDDDEYVRGTSYVFAPEDYDRSKVVKSKMILNMSKEPHLSPTTVISACGEDELNYEYRTSEDLYYGALTYAIHCILRSGDAPKTIREFNDELKNKMAQMFSSKRWNQTPYYETTDQLKTFEFGK